LMTGPRSGVILYTAMEHVARGLTDMIGHTIINDAPQLKKIPIAEIAALAYEPGEKVVGVYLQMESGLRGRAILILPLAFTLDLANLMTGAPQDTTTNLGHKECWLLDFAWSGCWTPQLVGGGARKTRTSSGLQHVNHANSRRTRMFSAGRDPQIRPSRPDNHAHGVGSQIGGNNSGSVWSQGLFGQAHSLRAVATGVGKGVGVTARLNAPLSQ
jgi:hypothetical protein